MTFVESRDCRSIHRCKCSATVSGVLYKGQQHARLHELHRLTALPNIVRYTACASCLVPPLLTAQRLTSHCSLAALSLVHVSSCAVWCVRCCAGAVRPSVRVVSVLLR